MNLLLLAQESAGISTASTSLDSDQWFVVILVVIGCMTGATIALAGIFAGLTGSIQRRTAEAELKREMLDRGMSADEISQVIEATPPTDFLERWANNSKGS